MGLTLFCVEHSWFSLPRSAAVLCVMQYCSLQTVKLISFVTRAGIKPCSPEMCCPCINLICASFQATLYIVTALLFLLQNLPSLFVYIFKSKGKIIFVFALSREKSFVSSVWHAVSLLLSSSRHGQAMSPYFSYLLPAVLVLTSSPLI